MTQHIEEARKLLAAEYDAHFPSYAELARTGTGEFTMCSVRAIAAALAAAEERGRSAERERCAQIADEHALSCSAKINKKRSDHDLAVFESAASEAMSIAHCIRKEPTP